MTLWSHRDHSAAAAYRYASAETTIGTKSRVVKFFMRYFSPPKKSIKEYFFYYLSVIKIRSK
jgi:hypothetical protein